MNETFTYRRERNGLFGWKYTLGCTFTTRIQLTSPSVFDNGVLRMTPNPDGSTTIVVTEGYGWDGATFAPDHPKIIRGTLVHDIGLDHAEEIVEAWGVPYEFVRKWFDRAFMEVNNNSETPRLLSRAYYRGVRVWSIIRCIGRKLKGGKQS